MIVRNDDNLEIHIHDNVNYKQNDFYKIETLSIYTTINFPGCILTQPI